MPRQCRFHAEITSKRIVGALALVFSAGAAQANQVIDFEGWAKGSLASHASFTEDGVTVTALSRTESGASQVGAIVDGGSASSANARGSLRSTISTSI
jgi:hypothetical protein